MSEAIPELDFPFPPPVCRDAAVLVPVRGEPGERELFWVRRGTRTRFSGGFHAYPGGRVDEADRDIAVVDPPAGIEPRLVVAALREAFEEVGLLYGRGVPAPERRAELRRELLRGRPFGELLAEAEVRLDASSLVPAGRWLTPEFSPLRYDTWFFLAPPPDGQEPEIANDELVSGEWTTPGRALGRWEDGSALLHPPTRHVLESVQISDPDRMLASLVAPPEVDDRHVAQRIEFQRGIEVVPLETPTLPPARHTNALIIGTGDLIVVDPGSPDPSEQEHLAGRLAARIADGEVPRAIVLTHHHRDHTLGAADLARRFDLPIRGSVATAARVPGCVGDLADGDAIELGGERPMSLDVVATEGHAVGHLAFVDRASGAAIVGDLVSSLSTIVIPPDEGDMGVYLASLRRLRDRPVGTLYPAHGMAIPDGPAKLQEYLDHREARMAAIVESIAAGSADLAGIVAVVYRDTPPPLHPIARLSALASLDELVRRGLVEPAGSERFAVTGRAEST